MQGKDPDREARAHQQATLERLAYVLDSAIPLPGGLRIGVDGLIGLIPGFGDLAGTLLASYIVAQAHRLGAPRTVLLHMAANIALETVVGAIPVVGDLFDFAWKANRRNVALLERHMAHPQATRQRSTLLMTALVVGLLALALGVVWMTVALLRWLFGGA